MTLLHKLIVLTRYRCAVFTFGKNACSFSAYLNIVCRKTCVATIGAMHFSVCGFGYTLFYFQKGTQDEVLFKVRKAN